MPQQLPRKCELEPVHPLRPLGGSEESAGGGRRAAGGVSVWCFGWSGVTYLEPLPGLSALWEEERETAVLLV